MGTPPCNNNSGEMPMSAEKAMEVATALDADGDGIISVHECCNLANGLGDNKDPEEFAKDPPGDWVPLIDKPVDEVAKILAEMCDDDAAGDELIAALKGEFKEKEDEPVAVAAVARESSEAHSITV